MKKLGLPLALLGVSVALIGCQLFEKRDSTTPPPVSQAESSAPVVQPAESHAPVDALACSLCVCSKFEPQSDAPATCRMCGHPASAHTRR